MMISNLAAGAIPAIAILLFLVGIHEWGHFFAARRFGIAVGEYAIGLGPAIWTRVSPKSQIKYTLRAIPLGGFVQIAETGPNSMSTASGYVRFIVYAAGPSINILFGFLVFFFLFMAGYTGLTPASVKDVSDTGAAKAAGLMAGDTITSINGVPVYQFSDIQVLTTLSPANHPDVVDIDRKGEPREFTIIKKDGLLGVYSADRIYAKTPMDAFRFSTIQMISNFSITYHLPVLLWNLKVSPGAVLQGPVAIADATGGIVKSSGSWISLLMLTGLLSLAIAFTNLIPIPILDGGRMCIILIESITRRKLNKRIEHFLVISSGAFIGLLLLLITYKDVSVYFT